jgi:hypothetical protein
MASGNLPYSPERADQFFFDYIGPYVEPAVILIVILLLLYVFYKFFSLGRKF